MRLPRARITVQRLMVVVAVLATVFGLEEARQRWTLCSERAERYGWVEEGYRKQQRNAALMARIYQDPPQSGPVLAQRLGEMNWDGLGCERLGTSLADLRGLSEPQRLARAADCYRRAEDFGKHAEICARLRRVYRRAVWRPWLPVPTGPTSYVS
jgi:hypothetical protein